MRASSSAGVGFFFWTWKAGIALIVVCTALNAAHGEPIKEFNVQPAAVTSSDVRIDYDLVYVRVPRREDGKEVRWAEFGHPTNMEVGADLMLLHPDGSEDLLVSGKDGSCMDPYVSFDGQWVFYTKFVDEKHRGADIHKIHVATRKTFKLTNQEFAPNTGAADWSKLKLPYGVYNFSPCPVPGGKVVFSSNRNAYVPPRGYPPIALQLFRMDEDGSNLEQIGYLNIAAALHPVILKDGRLIFSSLESQAMHQGIHWGIWSIHPDGTNWNPVVSALLRHGGAQSGFHFQSQLTDESIIVERYYNQNQKGFGTLYKLPPRVPAGKSAFGPGDLNDPRNKIAYTDPVSGKESYDTLPFTPYGMERITPWIIWQDDPAYPIVPKDRNSQRIGKVTHPCGAPDNHLLVAWSMGPIGGPLGDARNAGPNPMDSGLYLIKGGQTTMQPGEMLLIKNDPKYNEQWPRPLVSYERVYGVAAPANLEHRNDGQQSPHLPEGTPYGLIGASSMYKRESAPQGRVPEGKVTAEIPVQPGDTIHSLSQFRDIDSGTNWDGQGADAGRYDNSDIHAIRILIQEPLTDVKGHRSPLFGSHANERLRILGEIPVRKFLGTDKEQPTDPDGNPDTSFLAKIPANQSFTFQTLDRDGMVLNMAQTWHQVRPGEVRHDCGGCHAHSQQPTKFEETFASKSDYKLFDLTEKTALVTTSDRDESSQQWDTDQQTGLRHVEGPLNVEYWRDVRPIFARSCTACHTKDWEKPAGGLVLDDDDKTKLDGRQLAEGDEAPRIELPATYCRITSKRGEDSFYMKRFQSRRSYLIWKVYGRRLDGWTNDTFPSTIDPKDPASGMLWRGQKVPEYEKQLEKVAKGDDPVWIKIFARNYGDTDYAGSQMPPPEAVAGTFKGRDGQPIKVPPLSDEDRRTLVRWIDLGCPIDMDPQYDPTSPTPRSFGWMGDDQRPTLTITYPQSGENEPLSRVVIGMADAYTGLDVSSFTVISDVEVDGTAAGDNLAPQFKLITPGVWQWKLSKPMAGLKKSKLIVSVKDRQGNVNRLERVFSTRD
jgi:hypothetical protein